MINFILLNKFYLIFYIIFIISNQIAKTNKRAREQDDNDDLERPGKKRKIE